MLQNNLAEYAKRKDANQFYIDKQNNLISDLIDVYNYFEPLKDFEPIFNSIAKIQTESNFPDEISLINITYRFRATGTNTIFIPLNPFEQ